MKRYAYSAILALVLALMGAGEVRAAVLYENVSFTPVLQNTPTAARRPAEPLPEATGVCLNCGDDMVQAEEAEQAIAARWCSVECRDDWISRTGRRAR